MGWNVTHCAPPCPPCTPPAHTTTAPPDPQMVGSLGCATIGVMLHESLPSGDVWISAVHMAQHDEYLHRHILKGYVKLLKSISPPPLRGLTSDKDQRVSLLKAVVCIPWCHAATLWRLHNIQIRVWHTSARRNLPTHKSTHPLPALCPGPPTSRAC
jgi:hypothetical protein